MDHWSDGAAGDHPAAVLHCRPLSCCAGAGDGGERNVITVQVVTVHQTDRQ